MLLIAITWFAAAIFASKETVFDLKNAQCPEKTAQHCKLFYPDEADNGSRFPVISFAHGQQANPLYVYNDMLRKIADQGFIVTAPVGCQHDYKDGSWTEEQLRDDQLGCVEALIIGEHANLVDMSSTVGLFGHEMGGHTTLYNSLDEKTVAEFGIGAIAGLAAYVSPSQAKQSLVPTLWTGGDNDLTTSPKWSKQLYSNLDAQDRMLLLAKGGHDLCTLKGPVECPLVGIITSWFDCYLNRNPLACSLVSAPEFCDEVGGMFSACAFSLGTEEQTQTDIFAEADSREVAVGSRLMNYRGLVFDKTDSDVNMDPAAPVDEQAFYNGHIDNQEGTFYFVPN